MANNEELILNVETNSPYVIGAVAKVEQLPNGALITITDKNGTTTATVLNGVDGTGIASATLNADYTLTLLFTDGTSMTTTSIRGATGDSGVYIGEDEPINPEVNVWVDTTGDPYPMEDEIADAVDDWITAHPEYVTTVQDGAITVPKFAAGVVDTGLNKVGYPAESKATGDAIAADRSRLTAVEGEADALDARITSLATLTEGSTTGDAELIDARTVGSTTYASLHQAIDTEFTNVKSALNYLDYILVEDYSQYGNDKLMYVGAFESGGNIKISSPYQWAKIYVYNLDGTPNTVVGNDNAKQRETTLPSSGSIVYVAVYSPSNSAFDVTSVQVRIGNIEKYKSKYTDTLSDASDNTVAKTVSMDTAGNISYADSNNRVVCSPILRGDNVMNVRCSDKYKIINFYFDESTLRFVYTSWANVQQTNTHNINIIVVKKADESTITLSDIDELEKNVIIIKEFERGDFQTIYIASKDAPLAETSRADIVCDGTDDVAKINRALKYFEFLGVSGTLKFSQGKFIINDAYKTFSDTDKYLNVFGNKSDYPQRDITFEGTNPPIRKYGETTLQLNNTAVFSMTQSLYDSIQDDGYLMMFTCLQDANTGSIAYPKLSMNIKNIAIEIPNNKKPIILIDGKYASNMSVSNVIGCATLSNYSSGYRPEDIGIEKCIGIRGLDGMNFGEGYRLDNIFMYYMGVGFSLGGEHLIAQNLGTYGCYINYAMGLYGDRPSVHPNTLINCCGEQGVNDWVFGSNPYKQHISIIDYNMERMNNWPMNKAIERDLQNRYCGHITFQSADDTYTNNPNAEFWEEGYGEYFDTTNLTAVFNN